MILTKRKKSGKIIRLNGGRLRTLVCNTKRTSIEIELGHGITLREHTSIEIETTWHRTDDGSFGIKLTVVGEKNKKIFQVQTLLSLEKVFMNMHVDLQSFLVGLLASKTTHTDLLSKAATQALTDWGLVEIDYDDEFVNVNVVITYRTERAQVYGSETLRIDRETAKRYFNLSDPF